MKRSSTLFLKGAVGTIGLMVLAFCIFILPVGMRAEDGGGYKPILIGMYVTVIPFFIGIYQVLKLLSLIDQNKAFSTLSVRALTVVKYCASLISVLYAAGMPYIYMVAERDDAPGIIMLVLIIIFASSTIAVLAAVLQRLLHDAIAMKSENDLTI